MPSNTARYSGTYADARGSEQIVITNDGAILRTEIRGVVFESGDFDSLSPAAGTSQECLGSFTLNQAALCACTFTLEIPVPLVAHRSDLQGMLQVTLQLGSPCANGGLDGERLQLVLAFAKERIVSSGTSGWFEDALLEIHKRLPDGVFIKSCFNCLYSDYSPYGHGLFGQLMCFGNIKDEYLRVASKSQLLDIHERHDRFVQETYLCPQFARRIPGTGYRG